MNTKRLPPRSLSGCEACSGACFCSQRICSTNTQGSAAAAADASATCCHQPARPTAHRDDAGCSCCPEADACSRSGRACASRAAYANAVGRTRQQAAMSTCARHGAGPCAACARLQQGGAACASMARTGRKHARGHDAPRLCLRKAHRVAQPSPQRRTGARVWLSAQTESASSAPAPRLLDAQCRCLWQAASP